MRSKYIKIAPSEQTDSNKLNMTYANVAEDIADLYRSYISTKNDVEVHNLTVPLNIAGIENQLESIEDQLTQIVSGNTIATMYDDSMVVYPENITTVNRCHHAQEFGEATLPVASSELEFHYIDPVTGQRVLLDNIDQYVHSFITNNRFKPKVNEIYENATVNAVDATQNKAHIVKTRVRNSDINDITLVYTIETEGTKNINRIRVYPVPELTTDYNSITITKSNGVEEPILDNTGNEIVMPITNARRKSFHFAPLDINGISALLTSSQYTIIDSLGTKEFVIGSRLITLEDVTYINQGYIGFKVPIPSGKTILGKLTPLVEGYEDSFDVSVYEQLAEFNEVSESYLLNGNTTTIQTAINTTLNVVDYIYVLFRLDLQDNDTTPILKGFVISWL